MALPLASPSLVRLPPGTPRGHTARTPSYALRALRTPGGGGGADGQPPGSPGSWMAGERPNPFDDVRPQGKRSSSHARSRDRSSSDDDEEGRDDHAGSEDELVDADGEDEAEQEPLERAINLVGMGAYDSSSRRTLAQVVLVADSDSTHVPSDKAPTVRVPGQSGVCFHRAVAAAADMRASRLRMLPLRR
jgi:hypothetical protein